MSWRHQLKHEIPRIRKALDFYESELTDKVKYFWSDYLDLLDSGETHLISIINAVHYGIVLGYKYKENEERKEDITK